MFASVTRRLALCSVVSLLSSVIITGCSDTQSVKPEVTNVNDGGDGEGLALPTGAVPRASSVPALESRDRF